MASLSDIQKDAPNCQYYTTSLLVLHICSSKKHTALGLNIASKHNIDINQKLCPSVYYDVMVKKCLHHCYGGTLK